MKNAYREPEWKAALRWLALRYPTMDALARALPIDTTGEVLQGYLVESSGAKIGEERKQELIEYQRLISRTIQRTINALGAAMQADLPEPIAKTIKEEHSKLCATQD